MLLVPRAFFNAEELFFPVLAYNLQFKMPGACLEAPAPSNETNIGFLGNYAIWSDYSSMNCSTRLDKFICLLGRAHVSTLKQVPHLFAEKFLTDYEPEAYKELERWYFEKVKMEMKQGSAVKPTFDQSVYSSRSCSRLHL